ncbi:MAG: hypothetical protein WBF58_02300 [Xanthobacteraceae bacterium]
MNTANQNAAKNREPSEVELLLPWYAAGTLNERDAQAVQAALADDPELAVRYEWVRAELAEETAIGTALGQPSGRDAQALFAKIGSLQARRGAPAVDLFARIGEFFAGLSPRTLAWSAAAAALVVLLQAGVLATFTLKESPSGYQTASLPTNVTGEGSYALIRFQPEATAAQVVSFLQTNKLTIVGGPTAGGLYRVRVAARKLAPEELTHVVNTLRTDNVIGFIAVTD